MMPRLTTEQKIQQARSEGYNQGFYDGKKRAEDELKFQRDALSVEQVKAVTALMQESSKIMSRAGYMLGKLNKQEGW